MRARKNGFNIYTTAISVNEVQDVRKNRQIAGALPMDVKGAFDHVYREELA